MKTSRISEILNSGVDFKKYSYAELGRMFNYDSSKLRKKLIERGIVCNQSLDFNPIVQKSKEKVSRIKELALKGWTYSMITKELGGTQAHIEKLARENSISVRRHPFILETETEMSTIIGTLLGDGSIDNRKIESHNSRLAMKHSIKQLEYLKYKINLLSTLNDGEHKITEITKLTKFKDGRSIQSLATSCNWRSIADVKLSELRAKWYPEGKKIVPEDINLTPLAIAIWFMDDGTSGPNNSHFCTDGFSVKDCEILVKQLQKFNIDAYVRLTKKVYPHIVVPAKSIPDFIRLVHPFMCESMLYKLKKLNKYKGALTVN